MSKLTIAFGLGLVIGGVSSWAVTKSAWDKDRRFLVAANQSLNKQYVDLSTENHANESLASNSYNRKAIESCMLASAFRHQAIKVYFANGVMSEHETVSFRPLLGVIAKSSAMSDQARTLELLQEAVKLDSECLDGARVKPLSQRPSG